MNVAILVQDLVERFLTNNPFLICEKLNISVVKAKLPANINGFFRREGDEKVIVLNSLLDDQKATFCCAHELGHAIMHDKLNSVFLSSNSLFRTEKFETQADTFAAYLLFDDASILYDRLGICTPEQIASYYGVDKRIIKLRYESDLYESALKY